MDNEPLPIHLGKHKSSTPDALFIPEVEGDNGGVSGHQLNRKILRDEMVKWRTRLRVPAD
jgi:hypothetical protein